VHPATAPAYNPETEALDYLAGDPPAATVTQGDAAGFGPDGQSVIGRESTVHLDKAALGHPEVRYRDYVLEADVYPLLGAVDEDDAPGALEVILICPRCRHELRVTSDRKAIEYLPGPPVIDLATGQAMLRGVLSIERFECTWEKDTSVAVTGNTENLCRWRVAIDKNVARDA
jgi:hypothetical protein